MTWAPDYVTAEELAAFVRVPDEADEAQMDLAIAAASRAVDRCTRRQFGLVANAEQRFFTARLEVARARWVIEVDDLMTTLDLEIAFDADEDETYSSDITVYGLRPANAAAKARPWTDLVIPARSVVQPTGLESGVAVTARWGWTAVPDSVKQATLLQASRLLQRRDSPYGVAGSPEAGSELRLLAKVDPDVEVALADYKRRSRRVVFA